MNSIKERILKQYGEHVLTCDHPDFNFDIYMMFICQPIEYELMMHESRRKKDYDTTLNSIVKIIQTYKESK